LKEIALLYGSELSVAPLRLELEESCPMVMGDAQQLRQVVHNLVQNAQDSSESANRPVGDDCSVVLRTVWQPAAGRVRLSVLDHGTGFSDTILKRAFEPYVTTKPKGTGLGLAVVKKIADEHGTRVDIANRLQDGEVIGAQVSLSLTAYLSATT
jgi:nitrogen fixation/metabolism regulation signal transduction histidine kinase